MTTTAPLDVMRQIVGTEWSPSDGPSPVINEWLQFVGATYPQMAGYCASVSNGAYFSWCGATVGYCMARSGILPVFGAVDTNRFLYAMAWLGWGTPVSTPLAGDVVVFDFGGGDHHVTLFVSDNGDSTWACLGGNQTHAVKLTNFKKSSAMGVRRAPQQAVTATTVQSQPELKTGVVGAAVSQLQQVLGVVVDGEFGSDTDAAVRSFQASHGLDVDGVVGADTWAALAKISPVAAPTSTTATLSPSLVAKVVALARGSALARISWTGRGAAPAGYINGVAATFARVYLKLKSGDSAALAMTAPVGDPSRDALAWYGVPSTADRTTMLRQLFALLYGLGMRESSGNCFEGRDQSASNTSSDTAEAGLFQQSWNSRAASPELPKLFAVYSANPDGFLSIFREGVKGQPSSNEGSGDGAAFQALCKSCPAFAVEAAAVGLRTIRSHWGPVVRREAEIRPEALNLLQQVQGAVDADVSPIPMPQLGAPPVSQIDFNSIIQTLQPQIQAAIQQAISQAVAGAAPPAAPLTTVALPAPAVPASGDPLQALYAALAAHVANLQPGTTLAPAASGINFTGVLSMLDVAAPIVAGVLGLFPPAAPFAPLALALPKILHAAADVQTAAATNPGQLGSVLTGHLGDLSNLFNAAHAALPAGHAASGFLATLSGIFASAAGNPAALVKPVVPVAG